MLFLTWVLWHPLLLLPLHYVFVTVLAVWLILLIYVGQASGRKAKEEKSEVLEDLEQAYGYSSHAKWTKCKEVPSDDRNFLTDYTPQKLSSVRIFCTTRGTILHSPVLFTEQLIITLIFFGTACPVYYYGRTAANEDHTLAKFIRLQENKMRAFVAIMTGLAGFLLTLYTTIILGRWWTMRTDGVGAIKAATVDLTMLLHQSVTRDQRTLKAVQRYGRASLLLIFLWREDKLKDMRNMLMERSLLDQTECDLLEGKPNLHETIWSWQTAIVMKLQREGKIKSDRLYALLLKKCKAGRAAVQCVHTHLAVRVPLQYVHLLSFLVKMHNLILALILGLLFGAAWRNNYIILMLQLFGRTLILPFLFNAILLINCDLADPFNGGEVDFPGEIYQVNLGKDCDGIVNVASSLPDWPKVETSSRGFAPFQRWRG
jgi:hypothetical protein